MQENNIEELKKLIPLYNPEETLEHKMERILGPNPTEEAVKAFTKHDKGVRELYNAGWRPENKPTRQEIDDFVISEEKWQEALKFAYKNIKDLIIAAAVNRDNAVSHRPKPFKVGCAAAGIGPKMRDGEYVVWQGGNFKPVPGHVEGKNKRCAERSVLESAQSELKAVFAIVTVSKETTTGDETKTHDVLHPCKDCRLMFRELLRKGFLREDTIILNANDSKEQLAIEKTTLGELLELYKDDIL